MPKRSDLDWDEIHKEYRAGQLSIAEIARRHNCSDAAIHKRRKTDAKKGIIWSRDLTNQVAAEVQAKLARSSVTNPNANDQEIIDRAAERGADIVRSHRRDIANLRRMETQLINELQDFPKKLWLAQYKGKVIKRLVLLTAGERSMAANNLANVQHKRIQLERQAYSIDGDGGEAAKALIRQLSPEAKALVLSALGDDGDQ